VQRADSYCFVAAGRCGGTTPNWAMMVKDGFVPSSH
jgi:hypothetical protein